MRLIDADALERQTITIENEWHMHEEVEIVNGSDIDNAPTIDPVRHGKWEVCENDPTYVRCSECGELNYEAYPSNYCPNCGALMEVKE